MPAAIAIVLCLAATLGAPMWVLLWAPLLLGVPHVVGDVRYLVVRPLGQLPRLMLVLAGAPLVAFVALRTSTLFGATARPRLEVLLGCGAVLAAIATTGGRASVKALLAAGALALALLATAYPWQVVLAFGHAHNVFAFVLWAAWARASWRVAALYVACLALALWVPPLFPGAAQGLGLTGAKATLAAGLPAGLATGVVVSYVFAQLVHYVVWVGLMPAALGGPTLEKELGWLGVGAAVAGSIALTAWGGIDPLKARTFYLTVALFHGWLELAVVAHLVVRHARLAPPVVQPAPLVATA